MSDKHNFELTVGLSGMNTENFESNEELRSRLVEALRQTAQKVLLSTTLFVTHVALSDELHNNKKVNDVSLGDTLTWRGSLYTVREVGLNSDNVKLTSNESGVTVTTTRSVLLNEATLERSVGR